MEKVSWWLWGPWIMLEVSQDTQVPSLSWEDPLEKEMAARFSILIWRIPWPEEPGGL